MTTMTPTEIAPLADRVDALPWADMRDQLDARGFAVTAPMLTPAE
jgi:hypothetical protein